MAEPLGVGPADQERLRAFMRALLEDTQALERMLEEDRIEDGVRRIGAEQEVFLVDPSMQPAMTALELLERVDHPLITTELGLFNLEINLPPLQLSGGCLRETHQQIEELLALVRRAAALVDTRILLTGILPTIRKQHLTLAAMTPHRRYSELNRITVANRGSEFRMQIKGLDDLNVTHDNVMFEACNTAFQVHFQVGAREFVPLYNLAQAITAPVLAAAANSPVFLQHRLWSETRMALFRQSVDTRSETHHARRARARVVFGDRWVERSVLDVFREDIARFRVFLTSEQGPSSLGLLERGEIPPLTALCVHNGTVYRWNRPCYGVYDGKPHLRIEHRVLPAGPTVIDEVANAAFFHGLMTALSEEHDDITKLMEFDDAKTNFMAAARYGLRARFQWLGGESRSADELILTDLLPRAREGLRAKRIDTADIDLYLGVLEERVRSGRTGSDWILDSLGQLGAIDRPMERFRALTSSMYERHVGGRPVHEWTLARPQDSRSWRDGCRLVEQLMTVDVFTVGPDDLIDLATSLMEWKHVRHVPVEDSGGRLVGLISHRQLLGLIGRRLRNGSEVVAVNEIMTPDPITVRPTTSTADAMGLMRRHRVSCLPVVEQDGTLVGIVTERDFLEAISGALDEGRRDAAP